MESSEVLITFDEALRQYHPSRTTLYRWLREGRLDRARRPGDRRTYLDRRQLEALTQLRPRLP